MRTPSELLRAWLRRRISADDFAWLQRQLDKLSIGVERDLVIALGMIPRRLGKADLALSVEELADATNARAGWDPSSWTVDTAARVLALLTLPANDDAFVRQFAEICRTADAAEAIAVFSGLPLYAAAPRLQPQAAEALRGNIRSVFEAVAHRNPYPREQFDEDRWNQMVLKALFIGSTLHPIQGIDERANPILASIMCDYAHERWAAGRAITPEIWRCVGPFAEGDMLEDLRRVAGSADPREREAAALALSSNASAAAHDILESLGDEVRRISAGALYWRKVVRQPDAEEAPT